MLADPTAKSPEFLLPAAYAQCRDDHTLYVSIESRTKDKRNEQPRHITTAYKCCPHG